MRFTAFKRNEQELLCKKFLQNCGRRQNLTGVLSHMHPQRCFLRRNVLYNFAESAAKCFCGFEKNAEQSRK